MSKGDGLKIGIRFTESLVGDVSGNEIAFDITGQEYKYINGSLIDCNYVINSVQVHPTVENAILLTVDWWGKFNNVEGGLKVSYDSAKGNLQGIGGAVESFEATFTPEDLVPTPNPNVEEYISVAPNITVNFNPMEWLKGYESESHTITVSPVAVTVALTDVSIINP